MTSPRDSSPDTEATGSRIPGFYKLGIPERLSEISERTGIDRAEIEGAVEQFERLVLASREIIECHGITGEADYVIKVVVPDMKAYDAFLQSQIFKVPGVASVRSNVVLREVKYETAY